MGPTTSAAAAAAVDADRTKESPGAMDARAEVNNQPRGTAVEPHGTKGDAEARPTLPVDAEAERLARKALTSLQAEFALAGHELVQLADGSLMVSRWGFVRPLSTMDDARAWLARVTGRKASGSPTA